MVCVSKCEISRGTGTPFSSVSHCHCSGKHQQHVDRFQHRLFTRTRIWMLLCAALTDCCFSSPLYAMMSVTTYKFCPVRTWLEFDCSVPGLTTLQLVCYMRMRCKRYPSPLPTWDLENLCVTLLLISQTMSLNAVLHRRTTEDKINIKALDLGST